MKTIISKLLLIVCVVIVIVVYGFMKGGYDANAVVHEMLEKNDENDVNANMRNVPKMPGSKTLEAYSYSMNDTRVYVRTSETRQGVGAIADYFENEFAALGDVLNGKELEEDGEEFEETPEGRLVSVFDDAGTFYMAMISFDFETGLSTITTSKTENIDASLTPLANGDMPGFDIEDIPRLPGSKRDFSMREDNVSTMLYTNMGSKSSTLNSMAYQMGGEGWKIDKEIKETMRVAGAKTNDLVFMEKDGETCIVMVGTNGETGKTETTVLKFDDDVTP